MLASCASREASSSFASSGARAHGPALSVEPLAASTATIAFSARDACSGAKKLSAIPIAVVEDLGVPRYPPVLGVPIAFARATDLRSVSGLMAAAPDGRALASQAEALSRWGDAPDACGAPIRWAYVHVLATVPPDSRAYLDVVSADHSAEARAPALTVREDASSIVVDTGPARFTIDRRAFNGLAKVELAHAGAWRTVSERGGLFVVNEGRASDAASGKTWSVEVERSGPVVATIAAKGRYGSLFRYTVRLSFWAGTGAVEVDHTYYNGETTDITAHGGKNTLHADRVFMRVPFKADEVFARANEALHRVRSDEAIAVEQEKRTPDHPQVRFNVRAGARELESGAFAEHPLVAAHDASSYAVATIGFLGERDPQALRFDPKSAAIEVDFQSEPLFIGGARGIWSKAMLDFGSLGPDLALRGTQLYAHATRPLIGAPPTARLNETRARGRLPSKELPRAYRGFDELVDHVHDTTAAYLRSNRITGVELWPDLPRTACKGAECDRYFEGGDNNYWDWSNVELEEFLRTADPSFAHDFALPEAITMAETISFRPDPGSKSDESSFAGFAPCYGSGRTEEGVWLEGLNHRIGTCPGDYSYNKVHTLAYLLTADRRFTDFFTQGAETAIRMYKDPAKSDPDKWLELSASRTTYQYLQPLLDAAEFSRIGGDKANRRYRDTALAYFDHMKKTTLERGHTCDLLGTGVDDPKVQGDCTSDQAWMLPVWTEWVSRLAALYDHAPARAWLIDFAKMSAARHTALDARGLPDLSHEHDWRTVYRCGVTRNGVDDATCRKVTELENEGLFYANGLVAYLNAYGAVLDSDQRDPAKICAWLPDAYARALKNLGTDTNQNVWGKELGQAFALSQTTLGALEMCGR